MYRKLLGSLALGKTEGTKAIENNLLRLGRVSRLGRSSQTRVGLLRVKKEEARECLKRRVMRELRER